MKLILAECWLFVLFECCLFIIIYYYYYLFIYLFIIIIIISASCELPFDQGVDCGDGTLPSRQFYHDPTTRNCLPFTYLGCGGNVNRYDSLHGCRIECAVCPIVDCIEVFLPVPPCPTDMTLTPEGCDTCRCLCGYYLDHNYLDF